MDNNELPIPYTDFLYVIPVEKKQILVGDRGTLQTYGKILAKGPEAINTELGDYVAFELWDKAEFQLANGKICHLVREKDMLCKLPASWISL